MTREDLCRQIARLWAAETELSGWTFVEPDDDTPGSVYVPTLPPLQYRRAEAAALALGQPGAVDPVDPLESVSIAVSAVSTSRERSVEILRDLHAVLFPDGRARVTPETATRPDGIFGEPAGAVSVWRVVSIVLVGGPTPTPGGRPDGATGEGQWLATMSIRVRAHAVQLV